MAPEENNDAALILIGVIMKNFLVILFMLAAMLFAMFIPKISTLHYTDTNVCINDIKLKDIGNESYEITCKDMPVQTKDKDKFFAALFNSLDEHKRVNSFRNLLFIFFPIVVIITIFFVLMHLSDDSIFYSIFYVLMLICIILFVMISFPEINKNVEIMEQEKYNVNGIEIKYNKNIKIKELTNYGK